MQNITLLIFLIITINISCAQKTSTANSASISQVTKEVMTDLPYHQIPDYPASYSAENMLARMIDGLGYRYYWATKDLRGEDLDYKPSDEARPASETLDHIYSLIDLVSNSIHGKANVRPIPENNWTFEEQRANTLRLLKKTSDLLKLGELPAFEKLDLKFKRGDKESSFAFWHNLNGPLADAIWHTGQIVMMRRASGNPLPPGVNVFMGKTREK